MQVLAVVAHTDDETIGMGGTISRHSAAGDNVFCLAMTDGIGARGMVEDNAAGARDTAAQEAAEILGFDWLHNPLLPDNALDSVPLLQLIKVIETAASRINPDIIYTHSTADLNIDHTLVARAVLTAFWPQPAATWQEIRTFETASATDYGHPDVTGRFEPNLFVNIFDSWERKRRALQAYSEEMRPAPHSRSLSGLEYLACARGHQVGLAYAEAFLTIRKIAR